MLGSSFKIPQILQLLQCGLCVMAMVMTITKDANASERVFGVGYSRLSTADPIGGQMQYSLWYPTEVSDGVVRVGPFEFPGTWDAEPATGQFGLVILSHGSGGSDLGHWLACWSGAPMTVDRKTDNTTVHIPRAAVNLVGGIQPRVLKRAIGRLYRQFSPMCSIPTPGNNSDKHDDHAR